MFLFELYQTLIKKYSKDVRPFGPIEEWPKEWKTITYKVYERFPLRALPPADGDTNESIFAILEKRKTRRTFGNDLSLRALSQLLYFGVGEKKDEHDTDTPHRMYPSAGGRYPLECYVLLLKDIDDVSPGLYHYDVPSHGLRTLRTTPLSKQLLLEATAEAYVAHAVGALFLTGIPARSSLKYGERTYKLMLLEAGGVMENLSLAGEALRINTVHVGTCAEDVIEPYLDIDGHNEVYLHALFFG